VYSDREYSSNVQVLLDVLRKQKGDDLSMKSQLLRPANMKKDQMVSPAKKQK